jgi:hypothetical protein
VRRQGRRPRLTAVVAPFALAATLVACAQPDTPPVRSHTNLTSTQKAWGLAVSALLTERNGGHHDLLGEYPPSTESIAGTKRVLSHWWGVEDRAGLLQTLSWLDREGHRTDFEARGQRLSALPQVEYQALLARTEGPDRQKVTLARVHYAALGRKGLVGWDYARYVSLCRWRYHVGYLSEDEAWSFILHAARRVQATFDSWEDLGRNYLIGREYWSYDETRAKGHLYREAYLRLLRDPGSPWTRLPWYTDLG